MLVVFGKENADRIRDKMTTLELDTFMQEGLKEPVTIYAIIQIEDVSLADIPQLENMTNLHNTMLVEYHAKRFGFCDQALEHLRGKWKGTLDSFYDEFGTRIKSLKESQLSDDWSGVVHKS